jgi:surface protein
MEFDNETLRIAVNLYARNETEGEEKYGHINTWNVSNVTDMRHLFRDMRHLYRGAHSFNQPFNQPLNNWDVSNVTDMALLFYDLRLFNQPLDKWNVSNVTDMSQMFSHTDAFNQPLNTWNVSNVTNMYGMFSHTLDFNKPLNNWNVSNVTSMTGLFDFTEIGNMLKKHNLTNENYFDKKVYKNVYHEVFVWPRKKDYVTFLVGNQYLPLNKHQEKHEYHPLFDNPDMSKYIACYL